VVVVVVVVVVVEEEEEEATRCCDERQDARNFKHSACIVIVIIAPFRFVSAGFTAPTPSTLVTRLLQQARSTEQFSTVFLFV
jgi:hypothetical protein